MTESKMREALEEIVAPVTFMQERAKLTGDKIDGAAAIALSKDPEYLRAIALRALTASPGGERGKSSDELVPIYCKPWRTIVFVHEKHKADFLAKNAVASHETL
jgi:hypothetical protein